MSKNSLIINEAIEFLQKDDFHKAFEIFSTLANSGDPEAQNYVGRFYEIGVDVEKNWEEAAGWYRKSAKQGNALAQLSLGLLFEFGKGVEPDRIESFYWYGKAADQGHPEAQFKLAGFFNPGIGSAQIESEAFYCYKKAANQGHSWAQTYVRQMQNMTKDYFDRDRWASWPIRTRDDNSIYMSQMCWYSYLNLFERGRWINEDYVQAARWYRDKAEKKDPIAQLNSGVLCQKKVSGVKNDEDAMHWYDQSALQGHPEAMLRLAIAYKNTGDLSKAHEFLKWVAAQDPPGDSLNLRISYENNSDVESQISMISKFLKEETEEGYMEGKIILSPRSSLGIEDHGRIWLGKAVEIGLPGNHVRLGIGYIDSGSPKSTKNWLKRTIDQLIATTGKSDARFSVKITSKNETKPFPFELNNVEISLNTAPEIASNYAGRELSMMYPLP